MPDYLIVFLLGAVLYGLLEICWRGRTHWTMLICGGLCLCMMYLISASPLPLWQKSVLCALGVCLVEFVAGCIVNLRLGWQVWDYSTLPYNLLGQVCPQFLLIWLALSLPGLYLCTCIKSALT